MSMRRAIVPNDELIVGPADVPADAHLRRRTSPPRRLDRARIALGVLLFVGVAVCAIAVVQASARTGLHTPLAVLLGLALVPVVASPLEWLVHRFVYHQPALAPLRTIFTVHTAHHFGFFPTWRYTTSGPARRLAIRRRAPDVHWARIRNVRVRLAHYSWYMAIGVVAVWMPAWTLTHDVAFVIGLVVSTAVVSNLFIVVHDTIHRPHSHRIVETQPWFAFIDRHHYIHHVDVGSNLNFLLPLADLVFGTLRTSLTPAELNVHGSLEQAKARPIGAGESARSAKSAAI